MSRAIPVEMMKTSSLFLLSLLSIAPANAGTLDLLAESIREAIVLRFASAEIPTYETRRILTNTWKVRVTSPEDFGIRMTNAAALVPSHPNLPLRRNPERTFVATITRGVPGDVYHQYRCPVTFDSTRFVVSDCELRFRCPRESRWQDCDEAFEECRSLPLEMNREGVLLSGLLARHSSRPIP
jgi:hypothetical protein